MPTSPALMGFLPATERTTHCLHVLTCLPPLPTLQLLSWSGATAKGRLCMRRSCCTGRQVRAVVLVCRQAGRRRPPLALARLVSDYEELEKPSGCVAVCR